MPRNNSDNEEKIRGKMKVKNHKHRDDEESDDSDEEEEVKTTHDSSSDSESSSESESDSSSDDDSRKKYSYEEVKNKVSAKPAKQIEEKIDLDTLPLDKKSKAMIAGGFKSQILTFEYNGSLASMDKQPTKIELKATNENSAIANKKVEVFMVNFRSSDNKLPVELKVTHNGFPGLEANKICAHTRSGVTADYIAGANEEDDKTFVAYCQTKRITSEFFSNHKDVALEDFERDLREIEGVHCVKKGSLLMKYLQSELGIRINTDEQRKFCEVPAETIADAFSQLQQQYSTRNICKLSQFTITIERAHQKSGKTETSWTDQEELDIRFATGPGIDTQKAKEKKAIALHSPARFRYQLEVLYKPVGQA